MKDLTLVIPAKNESECLPFVINEIHNLKLECSVNVILSKNDLTTRESIKNLKVKIVEQSGLGYGNALIEGIRQCNTDFFCIFNADGSFDPNELITMYKKIKEENYDMIFGSRYIENGSTDDDTIITRLGNFFFTHLGNILFNLKISDILYTYVMGHTKKIVNLNLKKQDFAFCVELAIKCKQKKINYIDIPCHERKRIGGIKKVNALIDGFKILVEMVKLYFGKNKNF